MSIWYSHVRAHIHLDALGHNFRLIRDRCSHPAPIVKSDAYGHGLREAARVFEAAGATTMAAGTVGESVILKDTVPEVDVISLLGPLDSADYSAVTERDLVPFVGNMEQLLRLEEAAKRSGKPVRVALKFDTGMARLGFALVEVNALIELLSGLSFVRPVMLCSHLATADDPRQSDYALEQDKRFAYVTTAFQNHGFTLRTSLANSGAIFGHTSLHHDLQRPGIALYGGNPFHGTAWQEKGAGLRQAMDVRSRLLQIRTLLAGETVSYGRTFRADEEMQIGIAAVGYADNYARGLSSKGQMLVRGQRVPVLGRVCMQLTALDVSRVPGVAAGDDVFVLGGEGPGAITAEELANWWGTIPYEVFCQLGQNAREYTGSVHRSNPLLPQLGLCDVVRPGEAHSI